MGELEFGTENFVRGDELGKVKSSKKEDRRVRSVWRGVGSKPEWLA